MYIVGFRAGSPAEVLYYLSFDATYLLLTYYLLVLYGRYCKLAIISKAISAGRIISLDEGCNWLVILYAKIQKKVVLLLKKKTA